MPREKSTRGEKVSTVDITDHICKVCQVMHNATKIVYANGDAVISPMRCETCQTNYLTNLRVDNTLKQIKLLGNLKSRLSANQRDAITTAIAIEVQVLLDRFAGTAITQSGFDLAKIPKDAVKA